MQKYKAYISRCIQLAQLGAGHTGLNPLVGAVLVYNDKIIGEGFHEEYGKAHAEVNCINSVVYENKQYIPHSTLYVNLEPCNHHGKTPPCTTAILTSGIKKVVIGTVDENPLVKNKGIKLLKEKGVEVEIGICLDACYRLNKVFFTNQTKQRAFVKLKWAQSCDGFIGDSYKKVSISTQETNVINHKYRTQVDGIVVGYQTAITDEPQLNARHWQGKQPVRIFLDWKFNLPHHIISKAGHRNIVITQKDITSTPQIKFIKVSKNAQAIANALFQEGITSILVEGGARTHELFIKEGIWDEAVVIVNNREIEYTDVVGGDSPIPAATLKDSRYLSTHRINEDLIHHYSHSIFVK